MSLFSDYLKSWRLFRGLTQGKLSVRAGIPRPNLVALEQGRRECTLTTLNRLAHALRISPGTLLDHKPQEGNIVKIGRHEIDQVARSLLLDDSNLPSKLVPLRDAALPQARSLLQVAGIRRRWRKKGKFQKIDSQILDQILQRIRKLLFAKIQGVL